MSRPKNRTGSVWWNADSYGVLVPSVLFVVVAAVLLLVAFHLHVLTCAVRDLREQVEQGSGSSVR